MVVPADTCSAKCCKRRGGEQTSLRGQGVKNVPGRSSHETFEKFKEQLQLKKKKEKKKESIAGDNMKKCAGQRIGQFATKAQRQEQKPPFKLFLDRLHLYTTLSPSSQTARFKLGARWTRCLIGGKYFSPTSINPAVLSEWSQSGSFKFPRLLGLALYPGEGVHNSSQYSHVNSSKVYR